MSEHERIRTRARASESVRERPRARPTSAPARPPHIIRDERASDHVTERADASASADCNV